VRRPRSERGEPIEIEELRIDPREVQAYVDGESAELTPTEFRLLYTLALDRGHRLENDGDRIVREAIASLFERGIDPMVVIRWKDIFERSRTRSTPARRSPTSSRASSSRTPEP
jgi:hypothetical protein